MGIIRTAVSLAAFGMAANMVMKARRDGQAARLGAGNASSATSGPTGADSPNAAERLRARGVAGNSVGGGDAGTTNLFDSTSQDGAEARSPGLPDFARGA